MWAAKRKLFVVFIFLTILAGIAFYFYKTVIEKDPTCFDNIQNGTEEGVDCGGGCEQICKLRASKVNVMWAKTFPVSNGVSNIAALVENPNFDYTMSAIYNIKTFDNKGVRTHDFKNKITLAPGEKRIIFIPSVQTGQLDIRKTFVDFTEIESLTLGTVEENPLVVTSKVLQTEDNQTRLTVGIENKGLVPQRDVEIIAVLYTDNGDVVNVGKTFLEYFNKREEKKTNITWQKVFDGENMRVDVFLRKI